MLKRYTRHTRENKRLISKYKIVNKNNKIAGTEKSNNNKIKIKAMKEIKTQRKLKKIVSNEDKRLEAMANDNLKMMNNVVRYYLIN